MAKITLHEITFASCYWNVINLNVDIIKSDLKGMILNVKGSARDEVSIGQNLPLIMFVNSTIKNFVGTHIQLKMYDSSTTLDGHNLVLPVFAINHSTAEVSNSTFKGNGKIVHKDSKSNGIEDSAIFKVDDSQIVLTNCMIEKVQMDKGYDIYAVIYAKNSQM